MNSNNPTTNELDQELFKEHWHRHRRKRWMIPFAIAGFILILGGVFMSIWNAIIPELFQLPVLSFGQAIGLIVLSKILFGFGGRGGWGHGPGGGWGGWKHRHHWKNMSNEDREKLREALKKRMAEHP